MSVATLTTLRERVRDALDQSVVADPKQVADDLLDELGDDELREAATFGLRTMATEVSRRERERLLRSDVPAPQFPGGLSSRWMMVRDSLLRTRVTFEHRDAKFLGDCTAEDLDAHADWQERQADGLLRRAQVYRALGGELQKARVRHVRELPRDVVAEVFHV